MIIKPVFSLVAVCAMASFGAVACSASTDDVADEPASEVQDAELRKSLTSCSSDSDCVVVPRGGCCSNGYNEAVNKHQTAAYARATKCTASPPPMCPMFFVQDTRIATCDTSAHQCKMVAAVTALEGSWGASSANMQIAAGDASIEFGCGHASIDTFSFSDSSTFTGTGTHTAGSGVQPPPGMGPTPEAATFKGHLVGKKLTLQMKVGSNTSTMTFTKDAHTNLMHCL